MHQRFSHAAEENGPGIPQDRILHQARKGRRVEIAKAFADPAVPEAHLAPKITAGGYLHIQFLNLVVHVALNQNRLSSSMSKRSAIYSRPVSTGRPVRIRVQSAVCMAAQKGGVKESDALLLSLLPSG